jgi:hypothetical protein
MGVCAQLETTARHTFSHIMGGSIIFGLSHHTLRRSCICSSSYVIHLFLVWIVYFGCVYLSYAEAGCNA